MNNLPSQVKLMRELQKKYFKTRDKKVLSESIKQEIKVDKILEQYENKI